VSIDDVRLQKTTVDVQALIPTPRQAEPEHDLTTAAGPNGRPLHVLAVGINFGPEHTGIAPYTTQLCEHLAGRGAKVTGVHRSSALPELDGRPP